ncbi:MAG: RNA polymerase-binding protein DksA [Gammaproteobacteria bacterium]|nr:RNA polymerase-binding protein DksA [Gammaproteobacteria bacterium]
MPAKRSAPKSAKGKKAASRPTARKSAARKAESVRARAAVPHAHAHPRRNPVAQKKTPANPPEADVPATAEPKKTLRPHAPPAAPPSSAPAVASAVRHAASQSPAESDDGEPLEPGSLLAGPRNVQPYIVKRGELYMSKEQLEHFRNILNSWKRDLMVEVDRTVSHMKDEAANFPDPNDRATQEEEFSLELRTRDRERKLIRKIDDALKRIEDGSYGYCLETGEEIGIKRLEARPVATLSIEAQERRERRERQYGDRDDRYR